MVGLSLSSWNGAITFLDGCIILTTEVSKDRVEIKYQQLNPANHFLELVEASRCVILAGGTMSPVITIFVSSNSLSCVGVTDPRHDEPVIP